jgi:hypothetical protein
MMMMMSMKATSLAQLASKQQLASLNMAPSMQPQRSSSRVWVEQVLL